MLKKLMVLSVAVVMAMSFSACGKQDQGEAPAGGPPMGEDLALPQKGEEAVVEVPESVKGKWKGIRVLVEKKADRTTKEYDITLGQSLKIEGSELTVEVMEFLPSFVMQGLSITSASNEPNNPAAKITITEGGNEVFKGWLFQRFPSTHAFSHPDYSVTLLEGIPS